MSQETMIIVVKNTIDRIDSALRLLPNNKFIHLTYHYLCKDHKYAILTSSALDLIRDLLILRITILGSDYEELTRSQLKYEVYSKIDKLLKKYNVRG